MLRLLLVLAVPAFGIIVNDPPPSGDEYRYSYEIDDATTGDSKRQHEQRRGDVVSGSYSLLDPDGSRRTVEYTADPRHGFQAVVTKEAPTPVAVAPAPAIGQETLAPISPLPVASDALRYRQLQTHYRLPDIQDYPVNNFVQNVAAEQGSTYFTPDTAPDSKIKSDMSYFVPGQFFDPNYKYY